MNKIKGGKMPPLIFFILGIIFFLFPYSKSYFAECNKNKKKGTKIPIST